MASVALSLVALEDLDTLIEELSLPADTRARVGRALRPLEQFPEMGPELGGRWADLRFVLGPWRWMLLVYAVLGDRERVVVVTIQDARAGARPLISPPRPSPCPGDEAQAQGRHR